MAWYWWILIGVIAFIAYVCLFEYEISMKKQNGDVDEY